MVKLVERKPLFAWAKQGVILVIGCQDQQSRRTCHVHNSERPSSLSVLARYSYPMEVAMKLIIAP